MFNKYYLVIVVVLALIIPSVSFAHSAHDGGVKDVPMLHAPASIGGGFEMRDVDDGLTEAGVASLNEAVIKVEAGRSVIKVLIAALLIALVAFIVRLRPGVQNVLLKNFRSVGFLIGALVLSMLLLITITGMVLSLFYLPFPEYAYQSIQNIIAVPLVSYIRNLHYWASDLLLVLLLLHVSRLVFTKVVDKQKRIAYWTGLPMFVIVALALLFGTFLRSDQEAFEAYAHFWVGVAEYLPWGISHIAAFFGDGSMALMRFYVSHAILLPTGLLILLAAHAMLARSFKGLTKQVGVVLHSVITAAEKVKKRKFRFHQLRVWGYATAVLWSITALLAIVPAPFMSAPYNGLEVTKPPWYLLWVYGFENVWGMKMIVLAPLVLLILLIILPYFSKENKTMDAATIGFVVVCVVIVVLSLMAALGSPVSHLSM